jgi:nucleotide-binding universal stress UspA family protein
MTQRIVIALDPDAVAREAIELGHTLACATGARLTLLAVSGGATAEELLDDVRERLEARGNDDVSAHVIAGESVERALHHAAGREDTGLVVIGPSQRSAGARALARSTAARFLHGAACPVAIAPPEYRDPERGLERIGVAFADTPDAREALRGAAALARWAGATLRLIGVAELGVPRESLVTTGDIVEDLMDRRRSDLRAQMDDAAQELCSGVECEQIVLDGDAVSELATASAGVDVLVCGSRARGPLGSVLLGSVSRPLLDRTACPLLIVPRGREQRLEYMVTPHAAATG